MGTHSRTDDSPPGVKRTTVLVMIEVSILFQVIFFICSHTYIIITFTVHTLYIIQHTCITIRINYLHKMIDFIDLRIHNTYTVRRESRIKVVCCVLSLEAIGADPLLIFSAYIKIHHNILEPPTAMDTGTRHHAEGVRLVRTVVVRLE